MHIYFINFSLLTPNAFAIFDITKTKGFLITPLSILFYQKLNQIKSLLLAFRFAE
jgi:hypothetical protein